VFVKPREDLLGVLIGRKDRVEDVLDNPVAHDQGQPLIDELVVNVERGQAQSLFIPNRLRSQVAALRIVSWAITQSPSTPD
jgi:hypothetical protein